MPSMLRAQMSPRLAAMRRIKWLTLLARSLVLLIGLTALLAVLGDTILGRAQTSGVSRAIAIGVAQQGGGGSNDVVILDTRASVAAVMAVHSLESPPVGVQMAPDGHVALVGTRGTAEGVTAYDPASGSTAAFVPIRGVCAPLASVSQCISFAPHSNRAVVLGTGADGVAILDTSGTVPELLATHALPDPGPLDMEVAPDGHMALVMGAESLTAYELSSGQRTASFPLASASACRRCIAFTADSSRAVVLGTGAQSVIILDSAGTSPGILAIHPLTSPGVDVAVAPDGHSALVRSNSSDQSITAYELSGGAMTATIPLDGPCTAVRCLVFAPDSDRAFALGEGSDAVAVVDTSGGTAQLLALHPLSTAPVDVAMAPDGHQALVRAGAGGDALTSYDPPSGQQTGAVPLGGGCDTTTAVDCLTFTPDSARALVLGQGADAVTVVDSSGAAPQVVAFHALSRAGVEVDVSANGGLALVRAGGGEGGADGLTAFDPSTGAATQFLPLSGAPSPRVSSLVMVGPEPTGRAVGGIAELPDVSTSSAPPYAVLAGGLAAAAVVLTAGAWYARRRWGR